MDGLIWSSENLARLDGYPDIKVVYRTDWSKDKVTERGSWTGEMSFLFVLCIVNGVSEIMTSGVFIPIFKKYWIYIYIYINLAQHVTTYHLHFAICCGVLHRVYMVLAY